MKDGSDGTSDGGYLMVDHGSRWLINDQGDRERWQDDSVMVHDGELMVNESFDRQNG